VNEIKYLKLRVKNLSLEDLKKYDELCKEHYHRDLETIINDPWCGQAGFVMFNKEHIILTWGW
jgi:hypothetical protein